MSDKPIAPAVPAATILLVRDGEDGIEVFMVVRHHQIDFASGALVFPGGKTDEHDFDDALLEYVQGAADDRDMRAMQISAIREAFEECGVLLARTVGEDDLVSAARVSELEHYREKLNAGDVALLDFLRDEQLVLACDLLTHFAQWITPEMMPKRFDTNFYLAVAPADHVALHDGYESVDSVWITPQQAIADAASGTRTVIFPTLRNIEWLGLHATVAEAVAAGSRQAVVPVLPWMENRDDGTYLCIPPEAGYPVNEEKMPERAAQ